METSDKILSDDSIQGYVDTMQILIVSSPELSGMEIEDFHLKIKNDSIQKVCNIFLTPTFFVLITKHIN